MLETQAEMKREEQLIETQVYRCLMPPSDGSTPLSDDERTELLQWLVCGAPNTCGLTPGALGTRRAP